MNRNYRTLEFLRYLLEKEPEFAYHDDLTPEAFPIWQQKIKDKVRELMHLESVYETPVVNQLTVKQRDGYRIEKYEISSEEGLWNTMLLLVPDGVSDAVPAPAVLCMPGSCGTKEQLSAEEFYDLDYEPAQQFNSRHYVYHNMQALHCVRHGFVALAVDDFFVGETQHAENPFESWSEAAQILQSMGRSILGITCGMRLKQLQWLKTLPFVDRYRIGMIGHSLGTEPGMLLGLLDEEIRAFVFNDFLSDTKERTLACYPIEKYASYITPYKDYFGCYRYFTYPDLLAAFAPRPLLITEGGVTTLLEKVRNAYIKSGHSEAFIYRYYREYADPADRKYDYQPMPRNITMQEYFMRANVVPDKHYFKNEIAIPWLSDVFGT